MNYEQLFNSNSIEYKNSIQEQIAIENAITDLGDWNQDNVIALTYTDEPNFELGLFPNDVIVFQKDLQQAPRKLYGRSIKDSYTAIKLERSLYTESELLTAISDNGDA